MGTRAYCEQRKQENHPKSETGKEKVGEDVNTITVFINLVYRKPKVTRGDSHPLPEQWGRIP